MPPAVRLEQVRVCRGMRTVLDGVSVEIATGSFAGLVGPNGSGKTTLLQVILGTVRPQAGTVSVLGVSPADCPAVRRKIGYLPQLPRHDPLFPVSALDVVEMGALTRRSPHEDPGGPAPRELSLRALELVGLAAAAGAPFGRLSGGQRQLVLLARAIAGSPRLLLLDEPLTGLDEHHRAVLYPLVDRLRAETGLTALVVCHDFRALLPHVDRLLCLDGGLHEHIRPAAGPEGAPGPALDERCLYEALTRGASGAGRPSS